MAQAEPRKQPELARKRQLTVVIPLNAGDQPHRHEGRAIERVDHVHVRMEQVGDRHKHDYLEKLSVQRKG